MKFFDGTTAAEYHKKSVDALQQFMEGVHVCVLCVCGMHVCACLVCL